MTALYTWTKLTGTRFLVNNELFAVYIRRINNSNRLQRKDNWTAMFFKKTHCSSLGILRPFSKIQCHQLCLGTCLWRWLEQWITSVIMMDLSLIFLLLLLKNSFFGCLNNIVFSCFLCRMFVRVLCADGRSAVSRKTPLSLASRRKHIWKALPTWNQRISCCSVCMWWEINYINIVLKQLLCITSVHCGLLRVLWKDWIVNADAVNCIRVTLVKLSVIHWALVLMYGSLVQIVSPITHHELYECGKPLH